MQNTKIFFTSEGYEKLKQELADLRAKREPTVLRLQAAREQGDLSENGAYKAARFELSDIDRNIRRLSGLIKDGEVKAGRTDGKAGFGNTVTLEKDGRTITYRLVSKFESDPLKGLLSVESPIGSALLGKSAGTQIEVPAPAGAMRYFIKEVK